MPDEWFGLAPDALTGGASVTQTGRDLIKAGMRRLLHTRPGEYEPDPARGNQAYRYLHLPMTEGVAAVVAYSCRECIARYEDRVTVPLDVEMNGTIIDEDGGLRVAVPFTWNDTFTLDYLNVRFPILPPEDGDYGLPA
ncbi:MAG TPA: GPW/gp25 family protein [Deinococcales bacterium]|nr:GPW/gp25 family protein [Deinococcales bacterium]